MLSFLNDLEGVLERRERQLEDAWKQGKCLGFYRVLKEKITKERICLFELTPDDGGGI